MFSYEFCEISKNTFFYRTPVVAASELGEWISYHMNSSYQKGSIFRLLKKINKIYSLRQPCLYRIFLVLIFFFFLYSLFAFLFPLKNSNKS